MFRLLDGPAGGMGGEPIKAVLLKKYYGIGSREGTASPIRRPEWGQALIC